MRVCALIAVALWLTPVLAVGLTGLGLTHLAAITLGFVSAVAIGALVSGPLALLLRPVLAGRRALTVAVLCVSAGAIVQIARESVFMADSSKPAYSLLPGDSWRVEHSCMSGYFEAARFADAGSEHLYERATYQPRHIGLLKVDACVVLNAWAPSPSYPPTPFWLIVSGGVFVFALGVNTWCVLRLLRGAITESSTVATGRTARAE